MARTKIFKRSSDSRMIATWKPVLEGYGADLNKTPWLAEYAHNHAMFENATPLFEQSTPGAFLQTPGSLNGMGNPVAPINTQSPYFGGVKTTTGGSGDKFPSLLPVAIQVAAKTIGFDLVPVVPMDSPVGFLPYLDYVYAGGRVNNEFEPYLVKIVGATKAALVTAGFADVANVYVPGAAIVHSTANATYSFVGFSRVDGHLILKVETDDATSSVAADLTGNITGIGADVTGTYAVAADNVQLVSALENHISGFTGMSDADWGAGTGASGPYLPTTGDASLQSRDRNAGENDKFRQMGLRMFTKFVEAETDQVSISATVEQIQDLNRVWNYDVISMLENVAVNDLAQSINKRLIDRIFQMGDAGATAAAAIEGSNITTLDLTAGSFDNTSTLQRRFVTKVLELANLIYHRGRFGAGTFMVFGGRVASALADVAGYAIAQVPSDFSGTAGQMYPAGKVYGVQVFVDPNLPFGSERVVLGRKGADEEPGVKFMPYIMAESLQTIAEGTFSPKIGMKSRYAITEAGWHPETQYVTMNIASGALDLLTGSAWV